MLGGATVANAAVPPVRFSLAQFDSPGNDLPVTTAKLNAEYIVVTNSSRSATALKGWTIRDTFGHRYVFPPFTLRAGKAVRLHTGPGKNTATDLYWRQDNYVWNNTRDTAALRNPKGAVVDTCSWKRNRAGRVSC